MLWADADLGKRELSDSEKRAYDRTALRLEALRVKFSGPLGDQLRRMAADGDPDALDVIRIMSHNSDRDPRQTSRPPRQTCPSRWDRRPDPGD